MPAYTSEFDAALVGGKTNLDMRLRYESVDDNTNKDAKAATLRTRLGYQTGDYNGFFAFGEFEDVHVVGSVDEYAPETGGFAVVADPVVTQLNQGFIGYKGLSNTSLKLGRQRLLLDNARFIGNVGWRQNEQTFDALSFVNTSLPETVITYAYLNQVNGILERFEADVSNHLLNATYSGFKAVKITGYAYLLEDDDTNAENDTYGLRAGGALGLSANHKLLYTAEFADQSTENNDADYLFLESGLKFGTALFKVGYEVLGSDSGDYGFQTPFATKHAFNGWADQFLATPSTGLKDAMFTVEAKLGGVKFLGVYHKYSADQGNVDYGTESNFLAVKTLGRRYSLGLKYARYRADSWKTDTDKLWFWGQLKI